MNRPVALTTKSNMNVAFAGVAVLGGLEGETRFLKLNDVINTIIDRKVTQINIHCVFLISWP